ncbi:MAG: ATP-binding cassette domain-containing protein [Nitrospiraceae bacterium]|nr:ATP-binding cassette domain-containing protein [Nitrospiraceae bacterium]
MSPGSAVIEVEGLVRKFGKVGALQGIDLTINKGELFGVVGPDGAGKTTLLQSVCAILDPTEGSITVGGADTVRDAAAITSRIGYMSQAYSLYEDLTVEENLEFFARIRNVPDVAFRERRARLLEFSGLSPFLKRRTKSLSGGMQKKLALCCNLVHEPGLLVLDEPTLGVDPLSRRHLWDIILDYHARGKTIVVATSYMDEAMGCQRVAFLLEGKVLTCGRPSDMGGSLDDVFFSHIKKSAVSAEMPFEKRMERDVLVEVEGLVKKFGDFTAVDGISFSVRRGEIFGFLGPNGSGKTTTIRILCGILPPTGGTVSVAGANMAVRPEDARGRIGYMSQLFSLYLDLTVEENIDFFGGVYETGRDTLAKRKRWVTGMAGLSGQERTLTRDLSGALRQRLALGCALLHHPDVVFLDEPTSGVDPVSRKSFWDMIRAVADAGMTVFVTTHYLGEAENCNRVALLHRGRLLAADAPEALKALHGAETMEDLFIKLIGQADEDDQRTR